MKNKSLACAKCTKHVKEDEPREKIGRYTYCEVCAIERTK
jgi:hypothetical protein